MYESIKYFLQHDLDAFTGVDTRIKGDERYQYTKHDGSLVKCGSKDQFFHEGGAHFLGYDNKDSLTAFPLKKFDTLLSAMEHFNMEWHSAVAHLLVNTQYELFGNEMLKCTSFLSLKQLGNCSTLLLLKIRLHTATKSTGLVRFIYK